MAEGSVSQEIDAFFGQIELDVFGRGVGQAAWTHDGLLAGRHLRRRLHVEIAFRGQAVDEVVEQLGQLGLGRFVPFAAQGLEHLGRELTALDQRVEDRLAQRVERPIFLAAEFTPVGVEMAPAGEPRLEKEIGELVQE